MDQISLHIWLRLTIYNSLAYSCPHLVDAPNPSPLPDMLVLSNYQRLSINVLPAISHRLVTLSPTSSSYGNMAALVFTRTATCFRLHLHRRVTAPPPLRAQYVYHKTAGVSVDTLQNFLYILEPARAALDVHDTFTGSLYSIKIRPRRVQQPPPSRTHP